MADFPLGTWVFNRRALLTGVSAFAVAGCTTTRAPQQSREVDPAYRRKVVTYDTREAPGTIVVDPANHFLYAVQTGGQALRYGVGVGGKGLAGPVSRRSNPSRSGRTGIRPRRCLNAGPISKRS